jgi:hypothetical protein
MTLPYVNETELVMDVLRHGEHCAVLGPQALVQAVREQLAAALRTYGRGAGGAAGGGDEAGTAGAAPAATA